MLNTSKHSPLAPDLARAIYQRTYNRNNDVMQIYITQFSAIFSGGIAVRTSAVEGPKKEMQKLSDEEEENFYEFLTEGVKWIDMFGMVPFKRSRTSTEPRVVVPDFNSGQFVAVLDEDMKLKIGWKTNSRGISGLIDSNPDEDIFVYVHNRPTNQAFPFVSVFGSLLERLDQGEEMRQNTLRANHDATAPPIFLGMSVQRVSMMNTGGEADHFRDVAEAAARNRSLRAQQESRYSKDRAQDDMAQMMESERGGEWSSPREVCLADGRRMVCDRGLGYMQRRMLLPANRQPVNVQLPAYNSNWMAEEGYITELIYSAMRWPNPSSSRSARQKNATSGVKYSEADKSMESDTVNTRRELMKKIFRFIYRNIFRDVESEALDQKRIEAERKAEETLAMIPAGKTAFTDYLKWMEDRNLQFEHPYIRAQYEFQREQEEIKTETVVEIVAQRIVADAMDRGEILEMETVMRHLRIMLHERETAESYRDKLDNVEDRTELVFLQDSMEDAEMVMSMVEHGLMAPKEAAKFVLIGAGTEEKKAERLANDATGLAPVEREKLELEKQKLALEGQKLMIEKERAKTDAADKKEKNKIAMQSAKTKAEGPPSESSAAPKKKPKK